MDVSDQIVLGEETPIGSWIGPTGGLDSVGRVASTRLFTTKTKLSRFLVSISL
jgi:hypothetical protein